MTTSITSANIVLTLGVVGLFDTPQTIRGFAPDAAVATQAAAIGESQVGVDGFIAHGFVFGIMPIEVDLLANSPSIKFFDDWIAAELAVREKLLFAAGGTQVEGDNRFLDKLDPAFVARDLVDDRFVKKSIAALGGMTAFGLPENFTRSETIVA